MILLKLYAGVATLAAPILRRQLHTRASMGKELSARLGERRGHDRTLRPKGRLVWLHAASVGETISILPVIAALLAEDPSVSVLVTTGTVTSAQLLFRRLPEFGAPGRVLHRFAPLDVPRWARRFVAHWRPDVAGFVESEIWPNLLRTCRTAGVPLMLINARLSQRSFRMWRRVPGAARRLFGGFERVQAQSPADAERLAALGAKGVTCPGNLKFATAALPVDAKELLRLQSLLAARPIWLAASTHPGEERIVMDVHRALAPRYPGLLTIIAPRHPERGAEIAPLADDIQLTRRSLRQDPPVQGIWLADTMGELGLLYRLARIVFVGRSLAVGGGQNPIEPARLGCAVAVGPDTSNFNDAVATLKSAGALVEIPDAAALIPWVGGMLGDPERCAAMGEAGIAATSIATDLPATIAHELLGLIASPAA